LISVDLWILCRTATKIRTRRKVALPGIPEFLPPRLRVEQIIVDAPVSKHEFITKTLTVTKSGASVDACVMMHVLLTSLFQWQSEALSGSVSNLQAGLHTRIQLKQSEIIAF
jgi:hypothetical protein